MTVPVKDCAKLLAFLFQGCPSKAYPSCGHVCHPMCGVCLDDEDEKMWEQLLIGWIENGMTLPQSPRMILNDPLEEPD